MEKHGTKKGLIQMRISYNKLWKLLIDKGWNKSDLRTHAGISSSSLAKLSKNENVTTIVLLKICKALQCDISDIVEVISELDECHNQ